MTAEVAPPTVPIPTRMSPRARAYMSVLGVRHLLIGIYAAVLPVLFSGPGFYEARRILPFLLPEQALDVWGAAFVAVAVLAGVAVWKRSATLARWGLASSIILTALWVGTVVASLLLGSSPQGVAGATLWAAAAAKDTIMLSNPVRVPFEDPELEPDDVVEVPARAA